jgi:hypothetical protein
VVPSIGDEHDQSAYPKDKTAVAPAATPGPRASPRPDSKKAQLIARLEDPLGVDVATLE